MGFSRRTWTPCSRKLLCDAVMKGRRHDDAHRIHLPEQLSGVGEGPRVQLCRDLRCADRIGIHDSDEFDLGNGRIFFRMELARDTRRR